MADARLPRRLALIGLVALVVAVGAVTAPHDIYPGDPYAIREEARSMLLSSTLHVQADVPARLGAPGQYVVFNPARRGWYSKYGVVNALVALPPLLGEWTATGDLPALTSPSRLRWVNAWNVALSALLAALLFTLAGFFGARVGGRFLFVVAVLYSTFAWNYLRAQSAELGQLVLGTAFLCAAITVMRAVRHGAAASRSLVVAWALVSALTLAKLSYVLWAVAWAGLMAWQIRSHATTRGRDLGRRLVLPVWLPLIACVALLAAINHVKFGAPWLTGYHAWQPDQHRLTLDGAGVRLVKLLFGGQRGLLVHAPLLLGAALAWPLWWRRYPDESRLILLLSAITIVTIALLPSWEGGACYGPRYLILLVAPLTLPIVSLPEVLAGWRWGARAALAGGLATVALTSLALQLAVNHLPFMAYYELDARRIFVGETPIDSPLFDAPFGLLNAAFIAGHGKLEAVPGLRKTKDAEANGEWKEYAERARAIVAARNYWWAAPARPSERSRVAESLPDGLVVGRTE